MAGETAAEAFERGEKAGHVDQLLEQHAAHLALINGSVASNVVALREIRDELHDLGASMQSMGQQMKADADTRIALAAALKESEVARRQQDADTAAALRVKDDRTWLPVAKVSGVIAAAGGFVYLVVNLWPT